MNERIKELIAEADRKCSETRGIYDEILAKMIVRECAKRIDYWESRQGEHCDDLLKYFGVE